MIKVSFVFNTYAVEVTGETTMEVELDIVEVKHALSQMPPVITPAAQRPASAAPAAMGPNDLTPMGSGEPTQEIIPVTSIEKADLRGGKPAFKVRGGQYDMWGVMLYPDTCIFKDNIVPTMLMNEVVGGLEALVDKKNGKLRVIALRRKVANG